MSKLTRYKKGPVLKLPKMVAVKESSVPPPRPNIDDDDDDDDDFQVPIRSAPSAKEPSVAKEVKARIPKAKPKLIHLENKNVKIETCNTSQSEYFTDEKQVASEIKPSSDNKPSGSKQTSQQPVSQHVEEPPTKDNEEVPHENATKAVCPFCWKQLSDKLNGAIHVKACAKNLPTNQVMNAMELQDKQIKEWEELGIAYPGFVGAAATGAGSRRGRGTAATTTNRAPRTRKKKQDPQLELAMALSVSLHEEVEKRKTKEKQFLIETGLGHEIEVTKEVKKDTFQIPKTIAEMTSKAPSRRRGKKINLQELPLYKASESDRKQATEGKLSQIFDQNFETLNDKIYNAYNVKDPVPIGHLKSSSRLEAFIIKDSQLWKLSGAENATKEEFTNQAILDSKARYEEEERNRPVKNNPADIKTINVPNSSNADREAKDKPRSVILDKLEQKLKPDVKLKTSVQQASAENIKPKPDPTGSSGFKNPCNEKRKIAREKNNVTIHHKVVEDILNMFIKKEDVNLVVYGREEKPIKCHKLIVKARCPNLLTETVVETSSSGRKREVIALTGFSHVAVKAFMWFIYCGQLNTELSGQDLEDIQELSQKYQLNLESEESSEPVSTSKVQHVETQTEQIPDVMAEISAIATDKTIIPRSPDMFESSVLELPVNQIIQADKMKNKTEDRKITTDFNYSGDEDLFKDFDEEKVSSGRMTKSIHSFMERSVEVQRKVRTSVLPDTEQSPADPVRCEDRDGSRDLFEDDFEIEQVMMIEEAALHAEVVNVQQNVIEKNTAKEQHAGKIDDGILDDEIFTQLGPQVLLSPKKKHHTKRPRSPVRFDDATVQFSATQMAEYLEDCVPESPNSQQANKKHKLDIETSVTLVESENVNGNNDDSIVIIDIDKSVSSGSRNTSDFKALRKDTFGTIIDSGKSSNVSVVVNSTVANFDPNSSPCPSYSQFSKRINGENVLSTPLTNPRIGQRLFQKANPISPLPQIPESFANDPFANDMDDSCFANIPSEILELPLESPCRISEAEPIPKPVSRPTTPVLSEPQPSTKSKAKKPPGKNLKDKVGDNKSVNKTTKKTAKKNPSNISVPQDQPPDVVPVRQPLPLTPTSLPPNQVVGTPMLNYSTVETPILKRELKRFGLKPLPRSRAKVILRHIHKETHK